MFDNYHFFGCSWTGWPKNNYVKELARLLPSKNFYNWAIAGTSINCATYLLDYAIDKFPEDNNCFIFQVTNYGRVTAWEENYEPKFITETDNYFRLKNPVPDKKVVGFTPSSFHGFMPTEKDIIKYRKLYYKFTSNKTMKHQHLVHCHYAQARSNFMFFHYKNSHSGFENIEIVKELLGEKQYETFTKEDDNSHFGPAGCRWQADWLMQKDIFTNEE